MSFSLLDALTENLTNDSNNTNDVLKEIDFASTGDIISCFSFIDIYIRKKLKEKNVKLEQKICRLISKLYKKVPPLILLTNSFDLNFNYISSNWVSNQFYQPLLNKSERLKKIFELVCDNNLFITAKSIAKLYKTPSNIFHNSLDNFTELDPLFNKICYNIFKCMIINRALFQNFILLLEKFPLTRVLTQAFIDIINEYNTSTTIPHDVLAVQFSTIFVYINSFVTLNYIDGKYLFDSIISEPFVHPLLVLSIVNHISISTYCFFTYSDVNNKSYEVAAAETAKYLIVDRSEKKTLPNLVEHMGQIFRNHFSDTQKELTSESGSAPLTEDDLITFIHTGDVDMNRKYSRLLQMCKDSHNKIGFVTTSSLQVNYLRYILYHLHKKNESCSSNLIKGPISDFLSSITVFYGHILTTLFNNFENTVTSFQDCGYYFVGVIKKGLITLLHQENYDHFVRYITRCDTPHSLKSARVMLSFVYLLKDAVITEKTSTSMIDCNDIFIKLDFLQCLRSTKKFETFEDKEKTTDMFNSIIETLPFSVRVENNLVLIERVSNVLPENLNTESLEVIKRLQTLSQQPTGKEITNLLHKDERYSSLILNILVMTANMQHLNQAKTVTGILINNLNSYKNVSNEDQLFANTEPFESFCIASKFFKRLVIFNHIDLASQIIKALSSHALQSPYTFRWVLSMMSGVYDILPNMCLDEFRNIIMAAKCPGFTIKTDIDLIKNIGQTLLENQVNYMQYPEFLGVESISLNEKTLNACLCYIMTSDFTSHEIVSQFLHPPNDEGRSYSNRKEIIQAYSYLAAHCPRDLSLMYFNRLSEFPVSDIIISAAQTYIMNVSLETLSEILEMYYSKAEGSSINKLMFMLRVIVISFYRYSYNEDLTMKVLSSLLRSINDQTPKDLQETVVDVVFILYQGGNLSSHKEELIKECSNLKSELINTIKIYF